MWKETIGEVDVLLWEMMFTAQGKAEWTGKVGRRALPWNQVQTPLRGREDGL